jgi:hypothetical protein
MKCSSIFGDHAETRHENPIATLIDGPYLSAIDVTGHIAVNEREVTGREDQ